MLQLCIQGTITANRNFFFIWPFNTLTISFTTVQYQVLSTKHVALNVLELHLTSMVRRVLSEENSRTFKDISKTKLQNS